ncbi:MAG: hypothetical protein HGB08_04520 [Candidatus Moranbacteria bacterium]|nr:hypothetical protein [Candidatus Moranbacteria bacterium]
MLDKEIDDLKDEIIKSYVDDDLQATIVFLGWLADKIVNSTRNVDAQANIVMGLSTGIFVLAVNEISSSDRFYFTLMFAAAFSAVSAVIALLAIRPLSVMLKNGHEESMFFTRKISSFPSAKKYSEELIKILKTDDEIFYQYGMEIYNLSKYYYRPKRNLYAIARNIFLLGAVVSIISIFIELHL